MKVSIVLTVISEDRPGIIERLSQTLTAHNGNWVQSSMLSLAGKFAGILYAAVPEHEVGNALEAFSALGAEGIQVQVESAGELADHYAKEITLDLVGQDRPGIVQEIAQVLARFGVNVDELNTEVTEASMSGEMLFNAAARLRVPESCDLTGLQEALEQLANELMVDINLQE
jgi:glycine cleavage system regulatory protein